MPWKNGLKFTKNGLKGIRIVLFKFQNLQDNKNNETN